MAECEQPAQLKTLTEGRTDVAARRSFTAAAGVRGHGKMTLIPPTQPTADGIEVGTENAQSLSVAPPPAAIRVYLDLFAFSRATFFWEPSSLSLHTYTE